MTNWTIYDTPIFVISLFSADSSASAVWNCENRTAIQKKTSLKDQKIKICSKSKHGIK